MLGLHLAAVALVGGAVGLHIVSRRAGGSRATTIRLSPSAALHVVEIEGRRLLVGTGPASAPALLAELSPIGAVAVVASSGSSEPVFSASTDPRFTSAGTTARTPRERVADG